QPWWRPGIGCDEQVDAHPSTAPRAQPGQGPAAGGRDRLLFNGALRHIADVDPPVALEHARDRIEHPGVHRRAHVQQDTPAAGALDRGIETVHGLPKGRSDAHAVPRTACLTRYRATVARGSRAARASSQPPRRSWSAARYWRAADASRRERLSRTRAAASSISYRAADRSSAARSGEPVANDGRVCASTRSAPSSIRISDDDRLPGRQVYQPSGSGLRAKAKPASPARSHISYSSFVKNRGSKPCTRSTTSRRNTAMMKCRLSSARRSST